MWFTSICSKNVKYYHKIIKKHLTIFKKCCRIYLCMRENICSQFKTFISWRKRKVKMTRKLLSFVLAFAMLASCAVFSASAEKAASKYEIDFVYDVDEATATALISIKGGVYSVGRVGFGYNSDVFTLITSDGTAYDAASDFMKDVVVGKTIENEYAVSATEETNTVSELIDTENGVILFAWYTADDKAIDASVDAKPLAEVKFKLNDEYMAKENPAVALSLVEDTLAGVDADVIGDSAEGWNGEVYVTVDSDKDKILSASSDVTVSDTYITTDISSAQVTTSVKNQTQLLVTVSWNSVDLETSGDIAKYRVSVTNKSGTAILDENGDPAVVEIDALEANRDDSGNYNVVFNSTHGLIVGKEYKFVVTPVTTSGQLGLPTNGSADTSNIQGSVVGGGVTGGATGGGGASSPVANTIRITFDAVDGVIPEGQQYIFDVAVGGYVTKTPEVNAPAGKAFAGWSVDGTTIVDVPAYQITKAISFKAVYTYLTHEPFINGYPDGGVKPTLTLTRAEAAAIIARTAVDFDATKTYSVNFSDVAADSWYANYIGYVYEKGIVTGYEGGTFAPDNKITRAEFATIIQRYLGLALNENPVFNDVAGHWAIAYIGACKDAGLINGYENGEFRPNNQITRAEAVTILNRAFGRYPSASAIDGYVAQYGIPFSDVSKSDWYFYEVMEAAFAHLIVFFH